MSGGKNTFSYAFTAGVKYRLRSWTNEDLGVVECLADDALMPSEQVGKRRRFHLVEGDNGFLGEHSGRLEKEMRLIDTEYPHTNGTEQITREVAVIQRNRALYFVYSSERVE